MSTEEQAAAAVAGWEEADVAAVADIPEGTMASVEAGGEPFVVCNLEGTLYAYRDQCPHQGARMSCGVLTGAMLPMQPTDDYKYGLEGLVISCPRHHWKYEVKTGQSLYGADRRRLRTVPVRVEGDRVVIGVRRKRAAPSGSESAVGS